jgi:3-(3-hydroxy-phenyl)propionate hydroxylase
MNTDHLLTEPRVASPDDLYDTLIGLNHSGPDRLDKPLLAAVVMLLANHIGNSEIVASAVKQARKAFNLA